MIEGPIEVGDVLREPDGRLFRIMEVGGDLIGSYLIAKDGAIISSGWYIRSDFNRANFTRVEMPPYEPTGEIPQLGIS